MSCDVKGLRVAAAGVLGLAVFFACVPSAVAAATGVVPVEMPTGGSVLRICGTGSGDETRKWSAGDVELDSGRCYRVEFSHRKDASTRGATLCSGVRGINCDVRLGREWTRASYIVLAGGGDGGRLSLPWHFGLYQVTGAAEIKDMRRTPVEPLHAQFEGGVLGRGETIVGNRYTCDVTWGGRSGNYARALKSFKGRLSFNSNRWEFSGGGEMTFFHALAGRRFLSGSVCVCLQRYWRGSLVVDVSGDGGSTWRRAGVLDATHRPLTAKIPDEVLSASDGGVLVRLSGASDASMQVSGYSFLADVDGAAAYATGATAFAAAGEKVARPKVGAISYYSSMFGETVPGGAKDIALWRASSGWKVARTRGAPRGKAAAVEVAAAANEAEAVQLVVTPSAPLDRVRVAASAVTNRSGAVLGPDAVEVLRVRYVNVTEVFESTAVRGIYPDPLPPQTPGGVSVAKGESQPFWVRVKPPKGTPPGRYSGVLRVDGIRASGGAPFRCDVPFVVYVFGFELPDKMTCRTAFGLRSPIDKVHNAKTQVQRRRVQDLYFKAMDDYHFSPYYPAEMFAGKWKVSWKGLDEARAGRPENAEPVFDWTDWDREMERAFSRYNFTTFRLDSELGIGVGSTNGRGKVSLAGIPDDDPAYEVLLEKYLGAVERHLRERGWLDKALAYSFDEPRVCDSEYVKKGLMRARRYAPGIKRLLTAPVRDDIVGGPDIWCPIFPDYNAAAAAKRRAAGEEFWSYVCMYPHAPYATLFIEHPGVEMRTWLWQCRAEHMTGVLVWDSNNWRGRNPYETPMARSGEGGYYGNGDGLFLYPPESAAAAAGGEFIDEPPVGSIRGEMLRDGIEDYEYFAMLERLLDRNAASIPDDLMKACRRLLSVPSDVTRSPSDFSKDPANIERHRVRLAKAIMKVSAFSRPGAVAEPDGGEWQDLGRLSLNKEAPRAWFASFPDEASAFAVRPEANPGRISLDSDSAWRFHWRLRPEEGRPEGFFREGFDDSGWETVKVPCSWQAEGIRRSGERFGVPIYVDDDYIFTPQYPANSNCWPKVTGHNLPADYTMKPSDNPVGAYRRTFDIPKEWAGREVFLQFDGVESFFYLWVNGEYVGFSKDSRDPAAFDVTRLVRPGRNTVALEVYRNCDGSYLECQDMFRMSGIIRSVSVYSVPRTHVRDVFFTTRPSKPGEYGGDWTLDLSAEIDNRAAAPATRTISVRVYDAGRRVVPAVGASTAEVQAQPGGKGTAKFSLRFARPLLWSAESPDIYTLMVVSETGGRAEEFIPFQLGFRQVEIRDHGLQRDRTFLLNGQPIKMRGVNRHEFSAEFGHFTPDADIERDIMLMKRMNINHVRNAHYPEPGYFYYLCNKHGIYVMDEANIETHGYRYQAESLSHVPEWRAAHVDRTVAMLERNKNQPCVVIWSLGNEAGPGDNFKATCAAIKSRDTSRPVQYERNNWITDMGSSQYPSVPWVRSCADGTGVEKRGVKRPLRYPYHINEYAHNMGNAMGNLKDYQDAIESTTRICGAAIWDWVDQCLWKRDASGRRFLAYGGDFGDSPTDGQFSMDGCLLGDRTPKPACDEIRHVFQPFVARAVGDGARVELFNRNYFRDASAYSCVWTALSDGRVVASGKWNIAEVKPRGRAEFPMPEAVLSEQSAGRRASLRLEVRLKSAEGFLPAGWAVATDQLDLPVHSVPQATPAAPAATISENGERLTLSGAGLEVAFSKLTGEIVSLRQGPEKTERLAAPVSIDAFRAPTLNETRAGEEWYAAGLHSLKGRLVSFSPVSANGGCASFSTVVDYVATRREKVEGYLRQRVVFSDLGPVTPENAIAFRTENSYVFRGDGTLCVETTFSQTGVARTEPCRLGWRFVLNGFGGEVSWYGAGPYENYCDRMSGAFLGRWAMGVEDFFVKYGRPQSCGNRESTFELECGRLAFRSGQAPFAFGVSPFPDSVLAVTMHPHELPTPCQTYLGIYGKVRGLGGNSCGPIPLPKDRILTNETVRLSFAISGLPGRSASGNALALRRVGDTGYSGAELLPDAEMVCTAYVKYWPDARRHSAVSTRFRIDETGRRIVGRMP